ncbi:hypothetical protein OF83DRAFT_440931 [Amylostereum chailletii]|nr:hypothetical protein OF83DRAFT_440931 [Amylostereum chailletii]
MVFTCDSLGFFLLWTSTAIILYSRGVKAQDFSVPSGWTNHTSSAGPGQRAQLARDAIGLLTPRIDSTKGVIPDISSPSEAAAFLSILALNDWINGNTTYQTTVQSSIQTYESRNPNFVTQPTLSTVIRSYGASQPTTLTARTKIKFSFSWRPRHGHMRPSTRLRRLRRLTAPIPCATLHSRPHAADVSD